jgi:hypothetical protein
MLVAPVVKANATLADGSAARSVAFEVALWGIHFNLFGYIMSLSRLPREHADVDAESYLCYHIRPFFVSLYIVRI